VTLARWPALATPWLASADAAASALPPLAPGCEPDSLEVANPIRIAGISDGAVLRAAPHSDAPLSITLRALGTVEQVQWLVDGRLQGSSSGAAPMRVVLPQAGMHQITALADHGAFAHMSLSVLPPLMSFALGPRSRLTTP